MTRSDKAIQTDGKHHQNELYFGLKLKHILSITASLILPLILGVFTILSTNNQQKETSRQEENARILQLQQIEFEKERNQLQLQISNNRYESDLLSNYIKEIKDLLKETNASLKDDPMRTTIARSLTLNVIPQLSSSRKAMIIRFLYESKQLSSINQTVNFGISELVQENADSNMFKTSKTIGVLYLNSIKLKNCTFNSTSLNDIDMSWSQMNDINFSKANFTNVTLSFTRFENVDFSFARFENVDFSSASFENVNFSCSDILDVCLQSVHMKNVTFAYSQLYHVTFSHQTSRTQLNKANFTFAKFYNVGLSNSVFKDVIFSSTILVTTDFDDTEMQKTDFVGAQRLFANFYNAKLQESNFSFANIKNAVFSYANISKADFLMANLHKQDLSDAYGISNDQLASALSVQDVVLNKETVLRDHRLVFEANSSDCRFILQPKTNYALLSQRINLVEHWDSNRWSYSFIMVNFMINTSVFIELKGIDIDGKVLNKIIANVTKTRLSMRLQKEMQIIDISIKFEALDYAYNNDTVCDAIELFIDYGTNYDPQRRIYNIPENARWSPNGVTVAGGHGAGDALNQLNWPCGIYVDDDCTVYVADCDNHRIVSWKENAREGAVIAGGKGKGSAINQLDHPTDVIFDKESNSVIICDRDNRRVVRWDLQKNIGEILIDTIACWGIAMDDERFIYVSDISKHEVRKYRIGQKNGILVAGGNGKGDRLDQLDRPCYLVVDREQSLYVSDCYNHRVVKWEKNVKEGSVVAGGNGEGSDLNQLYYPEGIAVDELGTVYVADSRNERVIRWCKGDTKGDIIAGGNGFGDKANQFHYPFGLSFDRNGNLYVADWGNRRVQRFSIA